MKPIYIYFIVTFLFASSYIFSQQEIYLDNTPKDSLTIKSINGIELGHIGCYNIKLNFEIIHSIDESIITRNDFQLNYFHEFMLFPTIGLIAKGGFHLRPYKKLINDTTFYNLKYENAVSAGVQLIVEPRWHLGYKARYLKGKGSLNSGWYIGLPMEAVNYNFINTSLVTFSISPSLGFRQAFSKNIFLEGSVGYSFSTLIIYNSQPTASLKLGYAF